MHTLTTTRLRLRQWLPGDVEPFAALNADPTVMEFMPAPLTREQSAQLIERAAADLERRGLATEAARACLGLGFGALDLEEVVAFTVPGNTRSLAVMERLGMRRDARGDFAHPRLPPEHPLSQHVLYRLPRAAWRAAEDL